MINRLSISYSPVYPQSAQIGNPSACNCGQPGCQCAAATTGQLNSKNNPGGGIKSLNEPATGTHKAIAKSSSVANKTQLNEAELALVRELKQRDLKVRQHEMAHLVASGGLAQGGPKFSYQRGPDGQNYAIGGHVSIDTSPGKTPEETLQKAQMVLAAALAPADPSGQDLAVAAKASQMAVKARTELIQQQAAERSDSGRNENTPASRLAQRFIAAITPRPEPFIRLAA